MYKMKKLFLLTALLFGGLGFTHVEAAGDVPLEIIDESGASNYGTKAPPLIISQEDNVLTLPVMADDFVLELRDEDGFLVYSAFVPSGCTMVILPTWLSGSFELRLIADTYYYIGYIFL